jgi:hypothetical protein
MVLAKRAAATGAGLAKADFRGRRGWLTSWDGGAG